MSLSRRPPCFICRVPGELVEKFFTHLLPRIPDTETLRYPFSRGDVSDLCQCRLVCRMFHDVASRLLWRRVEIVFPGYNTWTPATTSFTTTRLSLLSQITRFLVEHAEIREYVRLLTITTNGPNFEQAAARTAVSRLSAVTPLLINLRVLSLHDVSIIPSHSLITLFLLPSLHTVRLGGLDCSSLFINRSMVNHNIKNLGVHRCGQPERLYALMPSLRAFDGEMDGDTFASMPLWASLEEASFQVDLPGWDRVARSLMAWRHSRRNIPLSLTELMVCQWHFNPKIRDLDSIISLFAGNPLRKLIIFYIEEPTTSRIERIAHLFPYLKQLSLLSDEELAHWPNNLAAYANSLRRLRSLQLLEWNYYDGDDQNVCGSWDMVNEDRLAEIVLLLAQTCVTLRQVNFCLFIDGFMGLTVTRDEEGNPEATTATYLDSWIYCTSAWKNDRFRDV